MRSKAYLGPAWRTWTDSNSAQTTALRKKLENRSFGGDFEIQ
jgi:hypothetical protein